MLRIDPRLSLYLLQATVGVVLLFNISIDVVYSIIPNSVMHVKNGVVPFDPEYFLRHTNSRWMMQALDSFGASRGVTLGATPRLRSLGIFSEPACPPGRQQCLHLQLLNPIPGYLSLPDFPVLRRPDHTGDPDDLRSGNVTKPLFVKLVHVPFYDIWLSKSVGDAIYGKNCGTFGYKLQKMILCAQNVQIDTNQTSVLMGTFHFLNS